MLGVKKKKKVKVMDVWIAKIKARSSNAPEKSLDLSSVCTSGDLKVFERLQNFTFKRIHPILF